MAAKPQPESPPEPTGSQPPAESQEGMFTPFQVDTILISEAILIAIDKLKDESPIILHRLAQARHILLINANVQQNEEPVPAVEDQPVPVVVEEEIGVADID